MANENRPPVKDRLKKKQATTTKIPITMSSDVAERLEEAEQAFALAQMQVMQDEDDPELKKKLEAAKDTLKLAQQEAMEDSVEFVFRNVGRKEYERLLSDHTPTDANRKEAERQGGDPKALSWNPETFPQAIVAAAIVHPHLDEEEVHELWDSDDWGGQELQQLFWAAMSAQQKSRVVQLGNV